MPCYHPMQASFSMQVNGKKKAVFRSPVALAASASFLRGGDMSVFDGHVQTIPCGKCIGCRLEYSRQWAVRCMHEASLHEDNCFLTLTYSPENLPSDGSLNKKHFQDFMKRLRRAYSDVAIRFYHCGEYGDDFGRPHYHACIFGFDFPDKRVWKTVNGETLYLSESLDKIWGRGFCTVGALSFESAAYVARYCTKKVNGPMAEEHYQGRSPEYATMSLKPGIGAKWYDKWKKDCFPSDYLVVNGVKCKPPRYYDKKLEKEDPLLFERIKHSRREGAEDDEDATHRRLMDREKCQEARFKKLLRTIERV